MKISSLIESPKNNLKFDFDPYVIAEIGVNHEGSIEKAKKLIDDAQEGGANAVKFQAYRAEYLALKDSPAYWDLNKEITDTQFTLFKKHDKFWKSEFEELAKYCDNSKIEFLSTPFDIHSAKFLNDLMPIFKISSSDMNNKPFIEFIAGFDKPILLSTGASFLWEIKETYSWIKENKNPIGLMHCVLSYPTKDEDAQLNMISVLRENFPDDLVGYSDHTLPNDMMNLEVATLLGARIIEKHFTDDKMLPGNDHYHAMDRNDLKVFRSRLSRINSTIGHLDRGEPFQCELKARENARRSLVSAREILKGEVITKEMLTWKRPAVGISPADYDDLIGKIAKVPIPEDTALRWEFFI